jgi:two-component system chemotaxis sensor kinase CheA
MSTEESLFQELLQTFRAEAAEHLQTLNHALLKLERATDDKERNELVQETFRAAHSLKGAARTVGFHDVQGIAHSMESVLQKARNNEIVLDPSICDVLYGALDTVKALLDGKEISLQRIYEKLASVGGIEPPTPVIEHTEPEAIHEIASGTGEDTIRVAVNKLDNLMAQTAELLISKISAEQHLTDLQLIRVQLTAWPRLWQELKLLLPRSGAAERPLTELLIRHNDVQQTLVKDMNSLRQSMSRDTLRLGMLTSSVQQEVRRVRMIPFNTIALSLQRAVRDAARAEDKQVAPLNIHGGDTELDRKVLETLKDSLIHLLSNAVSHGIELAAARFAANKSAEGQVRIDVQQRGSEVRISISDDGRGFDIEALRARANHTNGNGVNGSNGHHGSALSENGSNDNDAINLAFLQGVSTANQLSTISGRGVGLDVVRQAIEALQGRIHVESEPGKGSTIHLIVPVSLAMTRGLVVRIGTERYILPLMSIEKIVEPKDTFTVEGQPMIMLNGKPWPIVHLATILDRPIEDSATRYLAIVIRAAEQRLALLVDDVLTEQEVAVKSVSKLLKQVKNISGAALLGSGEPIIVLNAADLIHSAKGVRAPTLRPVTNGHKNGHKLSNKETDKGIEKLGTILVVDDSITTRTLEKNILQAAGYNVLTATDGQVALRILKDNTVDLVVSDVQMPNMDGITLAKSIRESSQYSAMPIILVTSLESREDKEAGMHAGANAYIVKRGFDQAELLNTIRSLLG